MKRQPRGTTKNRFAALLACCIGILCVLLILVFKGDMGRSTPPQFVGNWSVVDVQGGSRGTVTFSPDGNVDSHDDFVGKWSFRDGNIHVEFWKKDRDSLRDVFFPLREQYAFTPQFRQNNSPTALRGANVTMTRLP